jgi:hypothetical protein
VFITVSLRFSNTFLLKLIAERLGRGAGLHVELLLLSDEKVHQMNRVVAAGLYTTVRTLQFESALCGRPYHRRPCDIDKDEAVAISRCTGIDFGLKSLFKRITEY